MNYAVKKMLDEYHANKEKYNTPYYENKRKEYQKDFLKIKTKKDYDIFLEKWKDEFIGMVPYTEEMLKLRCELARKGIM